MVTIKVIYASTNNPVQSSRVSIGFGSGFSGEIYTDSYGMAEFEEVLAGRYGTVYVDGTAKFTGNIPVNKTIGIWFYYLSYFQIASNLYVMVLSILLKNSAHCAEFLFL